MYHKKRVSTLNGGNRSAPTLFIEIFIYYETNILRNKCVSKQNCCEIEYKIVTIFIEKNLSRRVKMVEWMYDREIETDTIEKLLNEGRHIQVCGPRKVGKTTILNNLNDRLETQCYYLNCETAVANSPDSIANSMRRLFHTNTPREAPGDPWKEVMYEVFEHLKGKNNDHSYSARFHRNAH